MVFEINSADFHDRHCLEPLRSQAEPRGAVLPMPIRTGRGSDFIQKFLHDLAK